MNAQRQKISKGRAILTLYRELGRRPTAEEIERALGAGLGYYATRRFRQKERIREGVIDMDYQRISASLIGNATKDGEVKQARESGKPYGDFDLAVRNRREETTYFPVRCFGKLAESVTNIEKGTKVFVDGELEISTFTGDDGQTRKHFRVLANTYRILDKGRKSADESDPGRS